MGPTQIGPDQTKGLADKFALQQMMDRSGAPLPIWQMADGSVRQTFNRGNLIVVPDLRQTGGVAPSLDVLQRRATDTFAQFGLLPTDGSKWVAGESLLWTRQSGSPEKPQSPVTPIRSMRFQRSLDGLPVFGPNSIATAESDANALIGLLINARPAKLLETLVRQKKPGQIDAEYRMLLNNIYANSPGSARLLSKTLCYFEQGINFIQPAYRYRVTITGRNGDTSAEELFVLIGLNNPEPNTFNRFGGFDPVIPDLDIPQRTPVQMTPSTTVRVGEYVVRQDQTRTCA